MTLHQLIIIVIVLVLIVIALVLQVGEEHINRNDVVGIVGFIAGAGFVVALFKGGHNK